MDKFIQANIKRKISMLGSVIMILATAYSGVADVMGWPMGEYVLNIALALTATIGTILGCDTIGKVHRESKEGDLDETQG